MGTAYRSLLRLYPRDFRTWFGEEMSAAFEARAKECRAHGWAVFLGFACRELAGVLKGAAAEWSARSTTDPAVRARSVPDLRLMRPCGITREAWFARVCVDVWQNQAGMN